VIAQDGRKGQFDVSPYLQLEAFEPLQDITEFKKIRTYANHYVASKLMLFFDRRLTKHMIFLVDISYNISCLFKRYKLSANTSGLLSIFAFNAD